MIQNEVKLAIENSKASIQHKTDKPVELIRFYKIYLKI